MLDHLLSTGDLPAAGGTVPGAQAHRAWEFRYLPPGYLQDGLELAEVQFFATQNGLNVAHEGVASASESNAGLPPANAIDGDPSTYWAGADNAANTRAVSFRLTFPDKRSLHHVSFIRTGQSFRFFKQFEIWASDTPDDASSFVRMYHTETIDIFGASTFWLTNRLWFVEWTDGGVDFSTIAHLTMNDANGVDHATGGTWTCTDNNNRFSAAQGVSNLAVKSQPSQIYGCRGAVGLVAYTPDNDFDLQTIDLTALDEVNSGANGDAARYTPLTLKVSSSIDGGQTRQLQWTCGSGREFTKGETRRFYAPQFLARLRIDFGPSQADQFSGWDRFRIRHRDGTYFDASVISIIASSFYNRQYHPVYVNDADSSRVWVTIAGGGYSPSWLEFAFFSNELNVLDIGGVEVTARPDHPESSPTSIKISKNTGATMDAVAGASWSNYAPFTAGETRVFNVAG